MSFSGWNSVMFVSSQSAKYYKFNVKGYRVCIPMTDEVVCEMKECLNKDTVMIGKIDANSPGRWRHLKSYEDKCIYK
jgi:hypothetical protein